MSKRCFVVQGFGKKHDYKQGKLFDLDASYAIIKDAIEDAGMECFRGDELVESGTIDAVMYEELLYADLVVVDISTLNFNAAYELGVRLALRPYATLIVGEKGVDFPFDINHIVIHTYEHLGKDVGYSEARRFQRELTRLAQHAVRNSKPDSPVYTFLGDLPPKGFMDVARRPQSRRFVMRGGTVDSLRTKKDRAQNAAMEAMNKGLFAEAVPHWEEARVQASEAEKNDFIIQQLALATYKSKVPTEVEALYRAKDILEELRPRDSHDPETLGLWAAVHKRLYEHAKHEAALDEALFTIERGFFMQRDHYNGINYAFLLDTKAATLEAPEGDELRNVARYVRRIVKESCARALEAKDLSDDDRYWIFATYYEACIGLGDEEGATYWKQQAASVSSADWMIESTEKQIGKLQKLLENTA